MPRLRLTLLTSAMLSSSLLLTGAGPVAAAGNWYVDSTLGNDTNSCSSSGSACQTIQAAVIKASAGDTIRVAAGTYPEPAVGPLTIDKTLTLLGAQNGVDARTRSGAESTITDPQGTSVGASGVVIDGFTVQDSLVAAFTGYGIWMNPVVSGTQIINDIIQNNIVGIGLANGGSSQALIEHNLIRNNNQPGGASGTGIYTDEFVGGSKVLNVLIKENTFVGHLDAGIDSSNTDSAGGVFGLDVDSNSFDMNGRAVVLFNTHMSSFEGNRVTNSNLAGSAAVRIFDNNSDLSIMSNDLVNGSGHAIRLSFLRVVGGPSSGVVIHENNIGVTGPSSFTLDGLLVDPGSHVGTVDAECNWWGALSGPTNLNNPGGTGEEVVGDADFTPWLLAPAPGGPCRAPNTPGKVTGGGQTPGTDPVFSATGDLVSAPAVVPSAASPTAQATFGFVVTCCAPKGNLEYNDHQADVRIKAKSISGLSIGTGHCGPNTHATFTGTAYVIRSTGTVTQDFTVDVDDCGEPGTADTFAITTAGYSNGPRVLIGGNIQIHK
jgi:hypothetical protein